MANSKAATSRRQLQPPPRTTKGTAKARGKPPPVKSGSSHKRQATDGIKDEGSSNEGSPPPAHHHKKAKQSQKADEEVDDDHKEPEIEVVDEEDAIGGEPIEVRDSDKGDDGLEDQHDANIGPLLVVKQDSMKDLLEIFSDIVTVKFKTGRKHETIKGRWCMPCKVDKKVLKEGGVRKAFFIGGNSSCQLHIRQHYLLYQQQCKEKKIPENHFAIPRPIWKQMQAGKDDTKGMVQVKLNGMIERLQGPREFTRKGVLHAISQFVACDEQALAVVDKGLFRNCLVAMRPWATSSDLPSSHDMKVYLHNKCVEWLTDLKNDILAAPGKISTTADGWTADKTKGSFLGVTVHWIEVKSGVWWLQSEVVAFQGISGEHSSLNLGWYFVGACDRVGITSQDKSKLYAVTLDNTSNNTTSCNTIASIHDRRACKSWDADENQLPCLKHVVNLANVAMMGHITKLATVENQTAIWEYDPDLPGNRILGGSLDIQASGQRIEYFEKLQIQCKITNPLKIPLHSNIRWGSAHNMLGRSNHLHQPINLFLASANTLFGPITTIRTNGRVTKKIPWSAFHLSDEDWQCVRDVKDILVDSNKILHHFLSEQLPTLWQALPAIEELQTAWEAKRDNDCFSKYKDAINDGLKKLQKYYSHFDRKPAYLLALALHPYYKLAYIKLAWGGEEEQEEDRAVGNLDAKNWQDEAQKILEHTMQEYWNSRPRAEPVIAATPMNMTTTPSCNASILSDFDHHCLSLVAKDDKEGWPAELHRYLKEMPADVTKDTDVVKWWQDNCQLYPTLARVALDVLPCQASSVPCERLFSAVKQVAVDQRARLGAQRFEELQLMKFAWCQNVTDLAAWNSGLVEEVDLEVYEDMLIADEHEDKLDENNDNDEMVVNN